MLRGDPGRGGLTRGGLLPTLCLMALASWGPAHGDALDGLLEVRSAYVNLDRGVFLLHARIDYPMSPAIRRALRDGLTLTFELEVRVDRERRFRPSRNTAQLPPRPRLARHAARPRHAAPDTKTRHPEGPPPPDRPPAD